VALVARLSALALLERKMRRQLLVQQDATKEEGGKEKGARGKRGEGRGGGGRAVGVNETDPTPSIVVEVV